MSLPSPPPCGSRTAKSSKAGETGGRICGGRGGIGKVKRVRVWNRVVKKTCVLNIVASKDLTPGLNFFAGTKLHKSGRSMNRQTKNNLRGRRSSPRKPRKASRSERQAGGREEGGRGRRGGRRGRDREEKWGAE
jgi:hypothetical protein